MKTRDDFIADYIFDWLSNITYIEVDDELMFNITKAVALTEWHCFVWSIIIFKTFSIDFPLDIILHNSSLYNVIFIYIYLLKHIEFMALNSVIEYVFSYYFMFLIRRYNVYFAK